MENKLEPTDPVETLADKFYEWAHDGHPNLSHSNLRNLIIESMNTRTPNNQNQELIEALEISTNIITVLGLEVPEYLQSVVKARVETNLEVLKNIEQNGDKA